MRANRAKWRNRRHRGVSMIYAVAVFTVLVGMASFAVDYGKVNLAKTELRQSVDAATLAASSGLATGPAEARSRAKAYALANKVNGQGLVLLDSDIELGTWDTSTHVFTLLTGANETRATAVRVTGRRIAARGTAVNLVFLPLIKGFSACELTASAISGTATTVADIVIVQDVTGSFRDEIEDAKDGDQALLDNLYANGGRSALGLVAFTGWGRTIAPLQTISGNYTNLTNKINSLNTRGRSPMPPSSGTDIAAGIEEGIEVFDNYNSGSSSRAMIIVSDGEPSSDSDGSHPRLNERQLLNLARQDADAAWAKNIHVYVVFFNRDNSQRSANNLRSLIRGNGIFIQVTDPRDLPAALASISQMLPGGLVK